MRAVLFNLLTFTTNSTSLCVYRQWHHRACSVTLCVQCQSCVYWTCASPSSRHFIAAVALPFWSRELVCGTLCRHPTPTRTQYDTDDGLAIGW